MMFLANYKEFGGNANDSIISHFCSEKYENQNTIYDFMLNNGLEIGTNGSVNDVITQKPIGTRITKKSGDYVWSTDLAYYVKKYNYRPPDEFINYILEKTAQK